MRALALGALVIAGLGGRALGQTVTVRTPGGGPGTQILQAALATRHVLVTPTTGQSDLPRDTSYGSTVIVLGRDATVESSVHGDVIVVGGDLFLHPGAHIYGRAIAIGGSVYNSSLAMIGSQRLSFREFTYDIIAVPGGYVLDYRRIRDPVESLLRWPVRGFWIPGYDRSNGVSIPFGPTIAAAEPSFIVNPRVTYRAQLGKLDPSVDGMTELVPGATLRLFAGRGTFTNDAWIYSDLVNSLGALFFGNDARNYYRADRAQATVHVALETATGTFVPYVGARTERGWSVRPGIGAAGGPWSLFDRYSVDDMLRPNPPIAQRSIFSALGGVRLAWEAQGIQTRIQTDEEVGFGSGVSTFAQTTIDGSVGFPTFGSQRLQIEAHGVFTGGTAPPQRYAYLGGIGTIAMLNLLSQGGDELLFVDGEYSLPIDLVNLPFLGPPTVSLHHVLGATGIGGLPSLEQRVGLRLTASVARIEFVVDPAGHRSELTAGFAFGR